MCAAGGIDVCRVLYCKIPPFSPLLTTPSVCLPSLHSPLAVFPELCVCVRFGNPVLELHAHACLSVGRLSLCGHVCIECASHSLCFAMLAYIILTHCTITMMPVTVSRQFCLVENNDQLYSPALTVVFSMHPLCSEEGASSDFIC